MLQLLACCSERHSWHAHSSLPLPRLQARHLRAILTSLAKCGQLEAALALVQAAKEEELAVSSGI